MENSYTIIEAKPMHCLAACISMIINSIDNNSNLTQNSIGEALEVNKDDSDDYYCGIKVDVARIKNMLLEENISTRVEYIKANTLEEWQFQEYLEEAFNNHKHIICTLASRILYSDVASMHGHAIIIVSISGDSVKIIDPDSVQSPIYNISIERTYKAARNQNGGLIVFS